jgi:hypothetical protein
MSVITSTPLLSLGFVRWNRGERGNGKRMKVKGGEKEGRGRRDGNGSY